MPIQGNEKSKAQKLVEKIESGNFDENDVDGLFMKLRAFSTNFRIFREVSDFVAHNDSRNQGIVNETLESFWMSFRFFSEYITNGKALDISLPFPTYVKKLMIYQVDKCDANELKTHFNVTKDRLKARIKKHFKENSGAGTVVLHESLGQQTLDAITHAMGFIQANVAFSQQEIIEELISVATHNQLAVDDALIRQQGNKIALCVLLLLNNTKYSNKSVDFGICKIACHPNRILHNALFVDTNGNPVQYVETYGNLQLVGNTTVQYNNNDVTFQCIVVTTDLKVEDWCDESLFTIEEGPVPEAPHRFRQVNLDGELSVNGDFNLIAAS